MKRLAETPEDFSNELKAERSGKEYMPPFRPTPLIPLHVKPSEGQRQVMDDWKFKRNARDRLRVTVKRGEISKPSRCARCGYEPADNREIHGHHADHSRPLDVEWLCRQCHHAEDLCGWKRRARKAS